MRKERAARLGLVSVLTTLLLSGCNGGGSDNNGGTPPPDTTGPSVSTTVPAADAANVDRYRAIYVVFDEDVLGTSVDSSSITLSEDGGPSIPATLSFDGSTSTATLAPDGALKMLTEYIVTATTTITDLLGNPMAAAYSWRFTTRDGIWETPYLLETYSMGFAGAPQLAFDANGNALAVWVQSGGGTAETIWASRHLSGSGWQTAEPIETNDAGFVRNLRLASDADGNALAVWEEEAEDFHFNIWASRYVAGTGWQTAELIETDDAGSAEFPEIAIDADGDAMAVWMQFDGTNYRIFANHYIAGAGWQTAELIENGAGYADNPQIAFDADGNAIAVWSQFDSAGQNIWANRFVADAGWQTAELIEIADANISDMPKIAFDADGNAMAVWSQFDGTNSNIWANRFVAGTGWQTAELIETNNADSAHLPQIAFDADGNAMAVWVQIDGPDYSIWSNRYIAGTGWQTPQLIELADANISDMPKLAIDADGNAFAVWAQFDGTHFRIWANRYIAGTGWQPAQPVGESDSHIEPTPSLAIDANGNAVVAWRLDDGTNGSVWVSRFD